MKTKTQITKWIMVLMLAVTSLGVWAQGPYPTPGNHSVCLGQVAPYGVINTAGSTYAWSITPLTGGNGTIAPGNTNLTSVTWTNAGTCTLKVIETNSNGCPGTPVTIIVTVNPIPTADPVSNVAYCNGATTTAIAFSGPVAGTTFSWTNSDATIGLGLNGTGNIPSFTATNGGTTPVVSTITVTPSANGCIGTPITFTITVNPTTTVNPVSNVAYCNGVSTTAISFTSPVAGTTFTWANNTPSIGLGASGAGNIPVFTATNAGTTPVVATITVTPSANGCTGTPINFTITVNPTPAVNPVANVAFCAGATTTAISFTSPVAGATFAWVNNTPSIGLGANGAGNIPAFTATNAGTTPVVATITVTPTANGCVGTPINFTITINPTTTVNAVSNVAYCTGATTTAISFTSPVAGTTFAWTNNTASIGLGVSGSGNIPAFTATNAGTAPLVASITVTPSANGCSGTPITFTITVNPKPTVDVVSNVAYCIGAVTTPISFTSPVAGTTFAWTNSDASIGLGASGTGNVPPFTATNATTNPIVATITVTPTANGCIGTPITFTITVNPSTTVNPVSNVAYCNNATTLPISLTSPVTGTTFTWTNSNAAIGLAVSGSGNIPSFTATNGGVTPIVATITVTPSASGCTGIPLTFTITVNPNAVPTLTGPLTMCVGTPGNLYSTDNGMSSYVWNVSAGGNITSGGTATSNTVTVTWNTAGAQTVSVNYTNTNGCTSPSPTPVTINVTPLPTTSPIYHN